MGPWNAREVLKEHSGATLSQIRFLLVRLLILPALAFLPARLAFAVARWRGRRKYRRLSPDAKHQMRYEVEQVCGPVSEAALLPSATR